MRLFLFIDDERDPNLNGYDFVNEDTSVVIARTSQDAIEHLEQSDSEIYISFDHDLGDDDTSMRVCHWLSDNPEVFLKIEGYYVHSQNPIGAENIRMYMENLNRFFRNT